VNEALELVSPALSRSQGLGMGLALGSEAARVGSGGLSLMSVCRASNEKD
jgi:hypothetical protein